MLIQCIFTCYCSMTKEEAYKILKLPEGASFDRVMSAKNKLMAGPWNDADSTIQVSPLALDGNEMDWHE